MPIKVIIEEKETNHKVATIYANLFDNGLVEIRRNVRNKLDDSEVDQPDNRLHLEQLATLTEKLMSL